MGHSARRSIIPTLAVAIALLGFAGCSSESSGTSTSTTSTTTSTTIPPPEASTVAELLALDRPIVLAHAGGENAHPGSTPFAYGESVKAGVDMLDFDVQLTGDGVLVVHHDDTVDRNTNGVGPVADMTYEEVNALDDAYWFTPQCSACEGEPEDDYIYRGIRTGEVEPPQGYTAEDFAITSFQEIIDRYPDYALNIEIKGSYPDNVPAAQELARILTEEDRLDQAVVTSFDDQLAEAFHEAAPEVAITPGLDAMTRYVLGGEPLPADRNIVQIPPEYQGVELLTPEFIERAQGDGLVLWIWPNSRNLENEAGYQRLLDMGVNGINAADPPTAVETLRKFLDG
ncbi:MAG: glycerophosphodiester phosphodiesterase family protein [Microthrixaceae bacterium]